MNLFLVGPLGVKRLFVRKWSDERGPEFRSFLDFIEEKV